MAGSDRSSVLSKKKRAALQRGVVIPAHPLALTADRRLDEDRQRALTRYYIEAGAGGLAVGVHTTQFAIRDPGVDLLRPVLELAVHAMREHELAGGASPLRIAGICGPTIQAIREAVQAKDLGYDMGLLNLGALGTAREGLLLDHCRAVGEILPLFGFYLQPAVGGRVLEHSFWRRFVEIPSVVAIKVAPFDRYRSLDVLRAVAESGRASEIALYTGNDDHIVLDLLATHRFRVSGEEVSVRMVGGLLGQWAVWTRRAAELLGEIHRVVESAAPVPPELLVLAGELTDANAAIFDAAHGFRGCIAGIHEVLRRQGLFEGIWCLDPGETLSPGQKEEIDRVIAAYPHLQDPSSPVQEAPCRVEGEEEHDDESSHG